MTCWTPSPPQRTRSKQKGWGIIPRPLLFFIFLKILNAASWALTPSRHSRKMSIPCRKPLYRYMRHSVFCCKPILTKTILFIKCPKIHFRYGPIPFSHCAGLFQVLIEFVQMLGANLFPATIPAFSDGGPCVHLPALVLVSPGHLFCPLGFPS